MPTPAYNDWKTLTSSNRGLRQQSMRERHLAAFATIVTGTNPDGTPKGS